MYNLWQNNKLKLKLKDFDFENIVLTGTINLANKDFWGLLTVLNSEWSHTPVVSLCVFSLVQTFCLTVRAYLNTQKYGLFCSLGLGKQATFRDAKINMILANDG